MADSDCSFSISNLFCQEDKSLLLDEAEPEDDEEDDENHEDEYIETLVSREEASFAGSSPSYAGDWLKNARSDAVQWILRSKACFSFRVQTAYLAIAYLDRFLARRNIEEGKYWAIKLSAVACLSLAAKMEEVVAPALSEFRLEEYRFHSETIQRMELLVLNTLEWRMSSVTPFEYLSYFASRFQLHCEKVKDLLSKAIALIFATVEAMNLVDYRPSVIAAAAILAASSHRLTKKLMESKISAASLCASLRSEQVYSCYSMMVEESHKVGLKTSNTLISSDISTTATMNPATDVVGFVSFAGSSSKRRRLE